MIFDLYFEGDYMKIKNCLSEGIGTFLLIFCSCFAICIFKDSPLTIAFTTGFIYLTLFYSFGNTSGCYFNPVISLSALIQKRISVVDFFLYLASQLIGAIFGVLFLELILPSFNYDYATFATKMCCEGDLIAGLFVDIIVSYLMVLTFLGANSKSRNKNIRGLIIGAGMILAVLISSVINYSLGNPVKAFAACITCKHWNSLIIFLVAPFIGGLLATYHFNWIKKDNEIKEEN